MRPAERSVTLVREDRVQRPIALCGGERVLADRLLREAHSLAERLPGRSHIINLCVSRYHFLLAFVAAMLRGQISLLPPNRTASAVRALLDEYPDSTLVGDEDRRDIGAPMSLVSRPHAIPARSVNPVLNGDRVIAVVFTSGSTGKAEAHLKTWEIFRRSVDLIAAHLGLAEAPGHATLATVPAQHMYGLETTVLLPLRSRSILTDHRVFYPADINSALQALPRPRMLVTTPIHLRACLESAGDLPPVELIVSATAPLPKALANEAERRFGARLIEIYGFTEAGSVATRRTSREDKWTLFSGIRLASQGDVSLLSAPYLPEPVALQDRIEQDGEGHFRLLGRLSDHINVAGKRTSLAALNAALLGLAGVEDGVFFVPQTELADESAAPGRLMAFAVAPGLTSETVLAELRCRIDAAFLPRPLFLVEALPRQENGKLSREALEALVRACRKQR